MVLVCFGNRMEQAAVGEHLHLHLFKKYVDEKTAPHVLQEPHLFFTMSLAFQ